MKFSEMPYTRVDFPAVIAQAQEIIQRASSAKSGEEQFEIHQEFNKLMDHVRTLYTIAHIRRDGDVTNEFYDGEKSYYDEKLRIMYTDSVFQVLYHPASWNLHI